MNSLFIFSPLSKLSSLYLNSVYVAGFLIFISLLVLLGLLFYCIIINVNKIFIYFSDTNNIIEGAITPNNTPVPSPASSPKPPRTPRPGKSGTCKPLEPFDPNNPNGGGGQGGSSASVILVS